MLYQMWQARQDLLNPLRAAARTTSALMQPFDLDHPAFLQVKRARAAMEVFGHSGVTQEHPPFAIPPIRVGNTLHEVSEQVAAQGPFGSLLHFRKEGAPPQPPVLIVAPMSGHFATLLRATVQTVLHDHDVYITDWHNARDVPRSEGRFGLDEFIDTIIGFLSVIGPGNSVLAVCQPVPAVMAAVAVMSEAGHEATPRSMTLMAGPVDTRIRPTEVNKLANSKSIDWFARNLIHIVPYRYKGAGRRVYPGAVQLHAFMQMNADRHRGAFRDQFRNLVDGEEQKVAAHRKFYDEYLAVMDLPGEFYLETVEVMFQRHDLPLGTLHWRGHRVDLGAIRNTALLTVEGERDDICSVGQTSAAHALCTGIPEAMKRSHIQEGVGHYGVFSGRRWNNETYPMVRDMIAAAG
jgi:poly(3-hydroxybutyrate) depolymerase